MADLERATGLKVPPGLDANTLSGLFMQRLARVPEVGDETVEQGYQLRILSVENRRVGKVSVQYIVAAEAAENGRDTKEFPTDNETD